MNPNIHFNYACSDVRLDVLYATPQKKQAQKRMESLNKLQKAMK